MRFCDKLPKLRKENNLSQEQLADKIGVSRQAVSKWESGSSYPDMDKMIQICSILNCTLEDLLDDGTIKESKTSNTTNNKNNFNNYLQDFLTFITKSYNMFCSMTFKEKIKFLLEMFALVIIILILGVIASAILNAIVSNILSIIPDFLRYYLYDIIETIYMTALFILGIVIIIHIFKIRYLDYFVTIEDQNVTEKTIEEPIEKIENKHYVQKDKEKIIIRDPKHSTFSFINFLGKIILYAIKFFSLFIAIFAIFFFIGFVFTAIMSLCHISYGIIFFYIFLAILGAIAICYIILEFIYRFIFDMKQNLNKLFIIFIISLIFIGIGGALTFVKMINYDYKENNENLTLKTTEEYLDMNDNIYIYFGVSQDNVQYTIDNSLNNIKLEITYPENSEYIIDYDVISDEENNSIKHYYVYLNSMNPIKLYKMVLDDLKNNTIRTYDKYDLIKIKVYLSEENYSILKNNNSIVY